jgi:two-component system, NtrC family, sensor kinase
MTDLPLQQRPRRMFPGGLRAQLLIVWGGMLFVLLALVFLAVLHVARGQLRDQAREHALVLSGTIAESMALTSHSAEEAKLDRLQSLVLRSGLLAAAWQDGPQLVVIAQTPRHEEVMRELIAQTRHHHSAWDMRHIEGTPCILAAQRALPGDPDRVAVVAVSLVGAQLHVDALSESLWVYILLNAIFILSIGYALFTFLVVRPVRAIGLSAERAAGGDLATPVAIIPSNELGQVARSFNSMLATIQEHERALEDQLARLQLANAALQQTQDSLLRAEKLASVGQLAAGVAHEVGNPLAAAFGYAELLEDDDLDEETRLDLVRRIQSQLERMRVIIRELLDFSRDDTSQPAQPTPLAPVVREAHDLAKTAHRARDVAVTIQLPDDLAAVMAVHSHLVQILINLIFNAADAMASAHTARPAITISARYAEEGPDQGHVILSLRDCGPGIPPAVHTRIFDPFFTTKAPGQGTGLGLSLSLRIAQRFGGDLRLATPDGQPGACFELLLPIAPDEVA